MRSCMIPLHVASSEVAWYSGYSPTTKVPHTCDFQCLLTGSCRFCSIHHRKLFLVSYLVYSVNYLVCLLIAYLVYSVSYLVCFNKDQSG